MCAYLGSWPLVRSPALPGAAPGSLAGEASGTATHGVLHQNRPSAKVAGEASGAATNGALQCEMSTAPQPRH